MTTLKLQDTINWCRPYLKNQPVDFANQEPALTTGNIVLQTMLGAPFKWRFNRGSFTFTAQPANATAGTAAVCDYSVYVKDFGFLEDQYVTIGTGATQKSFELGGKFNLARPTGIASRPTLIAAQFDDDAGNITFRTNTMPDQAYTISGDYQKRCPMLISVGSKIAPIPNEFAYVFNWGFLAVIGNLINDPRFIQWEKYFISRLLSLQDGLDQADIDIFLGLWQSNVKTAQRTQGGVGLAQQARGAM